MRTLFVIGVLIAGLIGFDIWQALQVNSLNHSLSTLKTSILSLSAELASTSAATEAGEAARRVEVVAKSQDQQLQQAVAAVTPAVVSIVESQSVPQLQVTYVNPFGNDPSFQGFGIQIPEYQQVGTTTHQVGAGTGFFIRSNGYILTNKHVVADTNATYSVLLSNGKQLNGTVYWRSPTEDLAIVKVTGSGYTTVPFGDSSTLALGESVFAVGNALGQYDNTVSVGIISGLNRSIQAQDESGNTETLNNVIQTDAAINPGNSGGPLVDLNGDVEGINVALVSGSENIGFAIPIDDVKSAIATLGI